MRKSRSLIVAAVLFFIFASCVHAATHNISLRVSNGRFGFWSNPYKDSSYAAISENITDSTILVMGSSEFNHGRDSDYHPKNMLNSSNTDLLIIGGAGNQILFHSIALGSLEKDIKNRKVILLVSPTWFRKDGVSKVNYAMRFSESEYIKFMQNDTIPKDIKNYVAERSSSLLSDNPNLRGKVDLINNGTIKGGNNIANKIAYVIESVAAAERDRVAAAVAMKDIFEKPDSEISEEAITEDTFDKYFKRAEKGSAKKSDNPFSMRDSVWEKHYLKTYKKQKNAHKNSIHKDSKEFDDLKAFLEVCKASNLKAKLIVMPVNGKWFDYIGSGRKQRRAVIDKITKLVSDYGAEYADLSAYDYEPYMPALG